MPPKEPKRVKKHHVVYPIFRTMISDREDMLTKIESFEKELGEFLDVGYTVVGSGMTAPGYGAPNLIYAIVTKEVS